MMVKPSPFPIVSSLFTKSRILPPVLLAVGIATACLAGLLLLEGPGSPSLPGGETAEPRKGGFHRRIEGLRDRIRVLKLRPAPAVPAVSVAQDIEGLDEGGVKTRLARIPGLAPGDDTDALELSLVTRWAALNPRAACDYAYKAVLCGADESLLRESVSRWASADPRSAVAWASALVSPSLRDLAISSAYGVWATRNRDAAISGIAALSGSAVRASAWNGVSKSISGNNAKQSLPLVMPLPGPLREKVLSQLFGTWLRRDPASVAEWMRLQSPEVQLPLAARLASEWARRDPAAALAWSGAAPADLSGAPRLSPGPVQRRAMDAAIGSFIASDPEAAAVWMTTGMGRGQFSQRVASLASSWASMDPQAAWTWASSIASARERDAAVGSIASVWTRSDPSEALRWIQGIQRSGDRNTALSSFGGALAGSDPEAAAYWSSQISDRTLREQTLARVVTQWKAINPGAAAQFVQTSTAAAFLRRKP